MPTPGYISPSVDMLRHVEVPPEQTADSTVEEKRYTNTHLQPGIVWLFHSLTLFVTL